MGGDEVQYGPWGVEACRAAVPACAWYALVIVSDWWHIGLRGVVFGDGQGGVVPLDGAGSVLCPLGASSRMVGDVQPSPDKVGSFRFVSPSLGASC